MQRIVVATLALGVAGLSAGADPIERDLLFHPASLTRASLESPDLTPQIQPEPQAPRAPVRPARITPERERPPAPRPAPVDIQVQALPPPVLEPAPSQVAQYTAPRRPNFGGGFIEFLFNGGDAPQPRQQPVAAAPSAVAPLVDPVERSYLAPADRSYTPSRQAAVPVRMIQPPRVMDPRFLPTVVDYTGREKPGTVIINTNERFLYLVQENGTAKRYGIGVGRPGFTWAGAHKVTAKREWPDWHPPDEMLKRQPYLPTFMAGGPDNPLGARALYLGSTLYRIHGSNEPWTIGHAVSSGCIRMRNEDVIDLYDRVAVGTKVVVI